MPIHTKHLKCNICPLPINLAKNKNTKVLIFSGTFNNPGSLLSPGMACAQKIHNASVGRGGWTKNITYNKLNLFGTYEGAPGGSITPPRNTF